MNSKSKKRLSILKAKNIGKRYRKLYLKELEQLVITDIDKNRILSLEKTLEIPPVQGDKRKQRFPFDDKEMLTVIIKKLIDEKDGEVFLITRYSMSCGAFILNSLRDFNICFDFEAEHQGLIQLRLTDSTNELLLDFYGENDERTLEVEVIGEDWLKVFDVGSL